MTDVTAIITGHREGLICGPSIASAQEAIGHACQQGIAVEAIVVLDAPDDLSISMFQDCQSWCRKLVVTDYRDPALTRNRGVREAEGRFITFLDADDLWSFNWIARAYSLCSASDKEVVIHSEINVIFGGTSQLWLHVDSESPYVDLNYLQIGNYWDALAFARRDTYLTHPFQKNDFDAGFGHEDWHWNCLTIAAGITHWPAPGTVHMKRRRKGSQSAHANDKDVVPWRNPVSAYDWPGGRGQREFCSGPVEAEAHRRHAFR